MPLPLHYSIVVEEAPTPSRLKIDALLCFFKLSLTLFTYFPLDSKPKFLTIYLFLIKYLLKKTLLSNILFSLSIFFLSKYM